ncbi:DUF7002 family protein [Micromonospora sp. NPDC049048]|uniref:DUF7002 family protein n=1 Tax=Micromonospora sp. NPDC049048 TaxID=3364263 RepID=UPI003720E3B6
MYGVIQAGDGVQMGRIERNFVETGVYRSQSSACLDAATFEAERCLDGGACTGSSTVVRGMTPLAAINSRVFFWASAERLDRLRQAKEYRTEDQVVLHVDTRALVERHGPRIELRRLNSGAVTQKNHPMRGHRSWLPIADYPYAEYRRRYGRDGALVEVTVLDAVPDILDLTDKIEGTID